MGKLLKWEAEAIVGREEMLSEAVRFILSASPDKSDEETRHGINRMAGRMFEALPSDNRADASRHIGKGLTTLVHLTELYREIVEHDLERSSGSEALLDAVRAERRRAQRR